MTAIAICNAFDPSESPLPLILDSVLNRVATNMWTRLILSLNVLFQGQTLLYVTLCSAGATTNGTALSSSTSVTTTPIPTTVLQLNGTSAITTSPSTLFTSILESATATNANATSTPNVTSTSTSKAAPTQTLDPATLEAIQTIASRRLSFIVGAITTPPSDITAW